MFKILSLVALFFLIHILDAHLSLSTNLGPDKNNRIMWNAEIIPFDHIYFSISFDRTTITFKHPGVYRISGDIMCTAGAYLLVLVYINGVQSFNAYGGVPSFYATVHWDLLYHVEQNATVYITLVPGYNGIFNDGTNVFHRLNIENLCDNDPKKYPMINM